MLSRFSRLAFLLFLLLPACALIVPAFSQELCTEEGCSAAIAPAKYYDFDAWRLSDGKTEAIVVPALGRVMSFRRVGGDEWLWSALVEGEKVPDFGGWKNWGGDKTWLSPQARWGEYGSKKNWPPAKEWDQIAFQSDVLPGGKLKIWGPVSPATGLRISRVFYHDENGEFVIEQTVQQLKGAPIEAGIWSIAQVGNAKIDAVFLPRAEKSDYENGFLWMSSNHDRIAPKTATPTLLQIAPTTNGSYKIGVDAPRAAIAAVKGDWAFILKTSRPNGIYPDGAEGKSGTPAQLYGQGDVKMNYLELELLSPMLKFKPGARWTHTMRWSLHQLPSSDADGPAVHAAINRLMD